MFKYRVTLFLFIIGKCLCQNQIIVEIEQGTLEGTEKHNRKGGVFYSFQSIPFAKPPVGDLRFREPQPAENWNGILDATNDLPQCHQEDYSSVTFGQEDCLYLNVYTPQTPTENYDSYKDVMIFIHGGGFYENSGRQDLYSPEYLMTGDIVLVTINYRLGIFGSFNLEDASLGYPGNLGLKDQSLAFKWVKQHIARFGGNTNSITIFGESAGAVSVHYHILSPLSAGTFHKAILQSGTAISPWVKGIKNNGILLAEVLGISTENKEEMLRELLELSGDEIYSGHQILNSLLQTPPNWATLSFPIVEEMMDGQDAFLTEDPLTVIQSGNYNQVPMIVGYNDAEGIAFHFMYSELFNLIPGDLEIEKNSDTANKLLDEIRDFYFNGNDPTIADQLSLIKIYTDVWFSYPSHRMTMEHLKTSNSPIYFYRFSADTKLNVYKLRTELTAVLPGATHCDDLGYLFHTFYHDLIIPEITPDSVEDKAIDRIVKLWTNFVKYSNPTPDEISEFKWQPVTLEAFNYVDFGSSETVPSVNPDVDRIQFWSDVYDKYHTYVTLETRQGNMRGTIKYNRKNEVFYSFQSIPFAKPPVGELRFRQPQPAENWDGMLDATEDLPQCHQEDYLGMTLGQEDCLYLNVYTPQAPADTYDTYKDVMIFIHGGGFYENSGRQELYSPEYLMTEDIVLVTINYRLGIFGSFNLDDTSLGYPGNLGLKDQSLAFQWVKQHIDRFGGNSNSITIFGESAGAVSVHYHVLSPLSAGTFHKAILQSGTAISPWVKGIKNNGILLAEVLGISTENKEEMLRELLELSGDEIYSGHQILNSLLQTPPSWATLSFPIVEEMMDGQDAFLTEDPLTVIQSGNYNQVPMIVGYNDAEGIAFHFMYSELFNLVPGDLEIEKNSDTANKLLDEIRDFYFNGNDPTIADQLSLIKIYTDVWFSYPSHRMTMEHLKTSNSPIYFYRFSADTKLNVYKLRTELTAVLPGATHCDDLGYLFHTFYHDLIIPEITPDSVEDKAIDRIVKLWTNFVKYSNPTPDEFSEFKWQPVTLEAFNYVDFGSSETVPSVNPDVDRIQFWSDVYDKYHTYVTLETRQGNMRGTIKYNRKNEVFYSFQSIPFAKPPVGELRFRQPHPAENWDGMLDATEDLPQCHQEDYLGVTFGQEDCLYLNVYTPQAPADTYDSYKDVMIFIHGGGFYENSGRQELYSPEYLMTEDIVLVTINYRLGIFGSFNLDDTSLGYPGNLGLKDQSLAFQWVKQHIDRFGGNSNSITIFGESAGAVSVHYHVLSPLSAGTFHKAILQSGTAISPWVKGIKNNGILLAEVLGISTENKEEMLRELLELSGDEIYSGHQILNSLLQTPPSWATLSFPIVEEMMDDQDAFLTEDPLTVIQSGNYNQVPMIVGYNDAEGIAFHFMYSELFNLIPGDLEIEKNSDTANELLDEIRDFYFNGNDPTIADQLSLIKIYTDVWFSYPSHRMTMEHLKTSNSPIYFYRFSADTKLNVYKLRTELTAVLPGATHCDDLGYLFHTFYHDLIIPEITPDSVEDKAIDRIVKLWTNFVKYSNPTPDEISEFKWQPVTLEAFNYADFGSSETVPSVNPDVDRIQFWSDVYDKYHTYVTLETRQGNMRGTIKYNRKNEVFYSFQSIPFAKPPVGELRFRQPQPAENWDGMLDATEDLPQCHQEDYLGMTLGQEDCLYLNVYTPQAPADTYDTYKDVMIFIHGGGFYENSGRQELYSPEYLMTEDIVLVTINYRLGIFGSFNLDDTSLGYPGNLGLKDQSLAFQWVKQHIDRFGGNSNSITIFGESAGAVSVHYHVLSPLSAGTFHKAILQSGTAISPWVKGIKNNGILLAEVLGISTENKEEMLRELLELSGDEIYSGHQILNSLLQTPPSWATLSFPIVEEMMDGQDAFLTEDPLTVIQSGNYNQVPMIVGYNDAEGIAFHFMYSELFNLIPGDLEIEKNSDTANELLDEIRDFYFNGNDPTIADQLSLIKIYTDVWFSYPSHRMTMEHLKTSNSPIYFYRFSADTKLNVYKLRTELTAVLPGATHCDDLGYLFHTFYHDLIIPEITPDSVEDKAIDRIVKLWTNFVKYSNPTPDEFSEFKWQPVTLEAFNYVDFGSSETVPSVNPDVDRIQFWSDVYDKYHTYVTLETRQGNMRGTIKYNRKNEVFYSFQSIPFAKPPVGELRFRQPQPAENWDGMLDATEDLPQCHQEDYLGMTHGQEDCLYLNVYTPQAPADTYDSYKDVMIFIHGGGFYENSGRQELYSPEYLMTEDIVLVTINYRLGIFGSFNLDDTSLGYPGNLGLKDQSLAFQWVKQHIDRFGGNSNSITIFGESAGAVSVHYHVLSPLSAGTFHKAILQSGTAISPWVKGIKNNGILLAEVLGISTENKEEMLRELLELSGDEIYSGHQILNSLLQTPPSWATLSFPIVEEMMDGQDAFLTEDPLTVIQSGNYNQVPMIVGYNDAEGIAFHFMYSELFNLVPGDLEIEKNSDTANELLDEIRDFYFNGNDPTIADQLSLIKIYTDVWFSYPSHRMTMEHLKTSNSPIYFYRFSADTKLNVYKLRTELTAVLPGATHCDDLGYLFHTFYHDLIIPEITPDSVEDKAIDRIVKLWTNFVKYSNPTPDEISEFKWQPVTLEAFNYVDFGSSETVPSVNPDVDRIQFWSDVYDKYHTYVTLETRQGNLRGTIKYNRKNGLFYSFQSIPFAKPPIRELRFKDPQPAENWDGTLDATKDLPQCYQGLEGNIIGQEDCLYLNVYTPQAPASDYDTYKDVMICIHGGGFFSNSGGEDLHSPVYLMTEDIVLVTVNYRLGIFGSFNLNDTSLGYPGNLGLKDQSLALKWVKQHIDRFGGNTNSITIFGESAGAVSVHYHVLSPLSAGTFHKAILQSGTAIAPWVKGIQNNGLLLAESLNIPTEDYEEMIQLLLNHTGDEIFAGYQKLNESVNFPIVEQKMDGQDAFLTEDPLSVIESGNYNHVPMMLGYNDAEGILFYSSFTDLFKLIPGDLEIENDSDIANELLQDIKDFYFNGTEPSFGDTSLINLFTDVWFSFPSHKMTMEHLKTSRNSIYFYRFSADTRLNVMKLINPLTALLPGAAHADDMAYLFQTILHNTIIPEITPNSVEDKAIDRIVTLWVNFAKHGNPTPDNFVEFKWEPVTNETFYYVDFGSTDTTPGVDPDTENIKFWYDIYEKYSNSKMHTSTSILVIFAIFTVLLTQTLL